MILIMKIMGIEGIDIFDNVKSVSRGFKTFLARFLPLITSSVS